MNQRVTKKIAQLARRVQQSEKRARIEQKMEFVRAIFNSFISILEFLGWRIACIIASAFLWLPVFLIIIAIKNGNLVIGKSVGFANFYMPSIWVLVIFWLLTSFSMSPKK
jgi:hypothetical protein